MAIISISDSQVNGADQILVADSSSKIPAKDGSQITILNATNVATGTIASARLDTGTTANKLVLLDGSGNLPVVDASLLTGIVSATISASDPTISTNPSGGVGTEWNNSTSGEMYICTDATAGANVWTNVGAGSGDVIPPNWFGVRGITAGGHSGTVDTIDYITIATTGNAVDFGNLTSAKRSLGGVSSGSGGRGVFFGSQNPTPAPGEIDYVTIATTGNASDFGDYGDGYAMSYAGRGGNGTRGLMIGGEKLAGAGDYYNGTIQYITIGTLGNGVDFGDMFDGGGRAQGVMDGTYCRYAGHSSTPAPYHNDIIESVTVATTGNAIDWADLSAARLSLAAVSSEAGRGVFCGGNQSGSTNVNIMDYITIATQANAVDFGDLTTVALDGGGMQNSTRGVIQIGYAGPPNSNALDYITIATTGNAADFGDLTVSRGISGNASGD